MGASKYMAMMAAHTGGGERPAPLRVPARCLCELQQRVYSHAPAPLLSSLGVSRLPLLHLSGVSRAQGRGRASCSR